MKDAGKSRDEMGTGFTMGKQKFVIQYLQFTF